MGFPQIVEATQRACSSALGTDSRRRRWPSNVSAVACSVYARGAGMPVFIDEDAIVHGEAGLFRKFDIGDQANANHYQIRGKPATIVTARGGYHVAGGIHLDGLYLSACPDLDACRSVPAFGECRKPRYSNPRQHSRLGLQYGHLELVLDRRGSGFKTDIAPADDDQAHAGPELLTQAVYVLQGA